MVDEAELGGMQLADSGERERDRDRVDRLASPNGSCVGSPAAVRRAGPPPAKRKKGPIPRELSTAELLRQLREGRGREVDDLRTPTEDEDFAASHSLIIALSPDDQQLPAPEPKLIPLEGSSAPSASELAALNSPTGPTAGIDTIKIRLSGIFLVWTYSNCILILLRLFKLLAEEADEHPALDEDLRQWSDAITRASLQKDNEKHLRAIQRLIRNAHGSGLFYLLLVKFKQYIIHPLKSIPWLDCWNIHTL